MKHTHVFTIVVLVLLLVLAACAEDKQTTENPEILSVKMGDTTKTFTVDDLKALPQTTSSFNETDYIGVTIPALLAAAEITVDDVSVLKAIAADGFSVNYEPKLFTREDVILAYALPDGEMSDDDGKFRMVLPGEEGKLNVRMVVTIEAVK